MTARARVPRTPPAALTREDRDVITITDTLWRIHRTSGLHIQSWDKLRTYGPLHSMRYDPHPEPTSNHPDTSVSYTAADLSTALAEVFQTTRLIDTSTGNPYATAWNPTRPLVLLDLTDTWALRNHAAAALNTASRVVCRAWARAIYTTWPDLDGILTSSTWTGRHAITLWTHAADTFPAHPSFSRPLAHPLVWSLVQTAARDIGYALS